MANNENSIARQIEIKAPVSKVWQALTNAKLFEQWFGIKFNGPFVAGKSTIGRNTYPAFDKFDTEFMIKEIRPETYFSYAWHPYAFDENFDYSKEEPTLVEFFLESSTTGTLLKVTETGFNKVTASRRAEAFKMHSGGWEEQLKNIEAFLVEKK
ncbi:MAG: SRPBCC family protein [Bdellovibrionota bacterium]